MFIKATFPTCMTNRFTNNRTKTNARGSVVPTHGFSQNSWDLEAKMEVWWGVFSTVLGKVFCILAFWNRHVIIWTTVIKILNIVNIDLMNIHNVVVFSYLVFLEQSWDFGGRILWNLKIDRGNIERECHNNLHVTALHLHLLP